MFFDSLIITIYFHTFYYNQCPSRPKDLFRCILVDSLDFLLVLDQTCIDAKDFLINVDE